ncbi:hypothetical protein H0H92_009905 [Tricholoma furcatifolium]|nr:hypothetical protein H0H92_009905 [Tricholoma furcatifolium]
MPTFNGTSIKFWYLRLKSKIRRKAHLAWFMLLPPELLIEIFVWCAANEFLSPLILQRVSKRWHALVTTSPRVWQSITMDEEVYTPAELRAQAELWVRRSYPMPFDVQIVVRDPDFVLPILSPFMPHALRWRSFEMQGEHQEQPVLLTDFNTANHSLSDLRISIREPSDLDPDDGERRTFFSYKERFGMQLYASSLPSSHLLAPLRITNLRIFEDSLGALHTNPPDILDFLSACPEIQTFCFVGWHHNEHPPPDSLPVVSLPHLHTLQLKSTCMTRAILSSIDTPQLVNLYLAHLNTEFEISGGGNFYEDGDSDDEAHDFSQSPSTDHATGMGLRALIKRCNPPIQVLHMDYSDMRTKDFRFVFDRLLLLETFLIVASDMSDTVIQLLRPFVLPGDTVPRVRLPRLHSLCLYKCNRLSGSAVVGTLTARVRYANQRPSLVEALNNVAIVTCDGVLIEHEERLVRLLGRRLHLN